MLHNVMKICFHANDLKKSQGVRRSLFIIKCAMFNWRLTGIANDNDVAFLTFQLIKKRCLCE
ncbi:hypothetical protein SOASR014_25290 [Pectobacterium carotovorum subsp. carotovorum]|nr:hypothetical protein SOASR014_25290 [Pectobacterium carotovorum subsp. carotovorum]GLX45344.1 hypothetical protein Pcaca01_30120 [Pectobacterium carotovorum subsp. carotovorum]